MKLKFLAALVLLLSGSLQAQNISYGFVIGGDLFSVANTGGTSNFEPEQSFVPNLGGYVEYSFSNKWGIKTELTFHNKELNYRFVSQSGRSTETSFKMSFIEVAPSLKWDFGQEYRKGGYMLLGPKFSFVTKATEENDDVKEAFDSPNIGMQWGLGSRIAKVADLQFKLDYEITPFFHLDDNRNNHFFGAYVSLGLDLERIF